MPNRRPPRPEGPPRRPGPRDRRPTGPGRERKQVPSSPEGEGGDRLQKILAHAGVGSRRACEELILQGRVTVDGKTVRELGTKVDPARAVVAVDGQRVRGEAPVYFAVYKPKGYVSTNNDPSGRPRVVDLLPEVPQRVYTVGRLDENSIGLMLLTNDGELANKLTHPKFGVEKVYRVIVAGLPDREVLDKLTEGVWLAEGKVRAKRVRQVARKGEAAVLEMVLAEGKNREVRRMLAKFGHKVMSLTRVAVGPITLKGLKPGQFRHLSGFEVDLLRKVADGIPVPMGRPAREERNRKPPRSDRTPRRPSAAREDRPPRRRDESGGAPPERYPRRPSRAPSGPQGEAKRPPRRGPAPAPVPPSRGHSGRPLPPIEPPPSRRRIIGLPPADLGAIDGGPRRRRPMPKPRPGGPPRARRPEGPPPARSRRRRPPEGEGGAIES